VRECPTCGKQLEPSVRFCPDDGTPVTETAAAHTDAHHGRTPYTGQRTRPAAGAGRALPPSSRHAAAAAMARVYRAIDTTLEREVAVQADQPGPASRSGI